MLTASEPLSASAPRLDLRMAKSLIMDEELGFPSLIHITTAYMNMKSNLVSPTTLASNTPRSRSTPLETRAKIIDRVRSGGIAAQFSTTGPAFNWTTFEVNSFSVENTNTNVEETSIKSQYTQDTDDVSWPSSTASSLNDAESLFGGDSYDTNNEQYSEAAISELTGFESNFTDVILNKNVVTNISDPGVGFTKCTIADTTFAVDMNDTADIQSKKKKKKKVSFDENNSVWLFECNETASRPSRRKLFHCGYSDDLIEDLGDTLRQILSFRSNFTNVRRHTPEYDDYREGRSRSSFDSADEDESDDSADNSISYREQIPRDTPLSEDRLSLKRTV